MMRWFVRLSLVWLTVVLVQWETPAPLIYRAGEGWSYEPVGGGKWVRGRAKDQLAVAKKAFEAKDYRVALKASRRVVRTWPFSDYAPEAQYLLGRCYEVRRQDEKAFKAYQKLLEKYPGWKDYQEVLRRQFEIANRFLAGQWFKLWGVIPFFPSMDKTSDMYDKIIKNGPYSDVAAQAQMNIGAAREKQSEFDKAAKAYETATERYQQDRPEVAATALYKEGLAYDKEAKTGEYDQSVAGKAIGTFGDFMALYPSDARTKETEKLITALKTEQARGNFRIARFYEKRKSWDGAMVYYNEVLLKDPTSIYADQAKTRIQEIKETKNRLQKPAHKPAQP